MSPSTIKVARLPGLSADCSSLPYGCQKIRQSGSRRRSRRLGKLLSRFGLAEHEWLLACIQILPRPTALFLILVTGYGRLAQREESEVRAEFGQAWSDYATRTPGFIPRLWHPSGKLPGPERSVHA